MTHIKLDNINKVYENGFHAVHDFSMDIEKGEFIVLVGPSGCGKSTTLRMIAGLEDISGGELVINEKIANKLSPRERGIAMVFQSYALYPNMSVYENLAFGLTLKGINQEIVEGRVHRIAKILGLMPYLERMPRELSGGQRQRVAVGRAIIRHVEVFLMDEPLSNLDAKQRVTMRAEITQIHRRVGATTIYVTHDQTEAMSMADRIVIMKDGRVQQIGTPKDVYFSPVNKFVAGFIGEPPMNFFDGAMNGNVFEGKGISCDMSAYPALCNRYDGKNLCMAFRPEAAKVAWGDGVTGAVLEGVVELTEMLGDNTNIYFNMEDDIRGIIKVAPKDTIPMGETCRFIVPSESIYLFDPETEFAVEKA